MCENFGSEDSGRSRSGAVLRRDVWRSHHRILKTSGMLTSRGLRVCDNEVYRKNWRSETAAFSKGFKDPRAGRAHCEHLQKSAPLSSVKLGLQASEVWVRA